jgi:flagellar protein FliS
MAINNLNGEAFDQYRENTVFTSTKEELVLMLYNGIIKFIMQAKASIDENNLEKANNSIKKAQEIIYELKINLDMKYDISNNLTLLYDYICQRLIDANIGKDNSILDEVLEFTKELRDTWAEAIRLVKNQKNGK